MRRLPPTIAATAAILAVAMPVSAQQREPIPQNDPEPGSQTTYRPAPLQHQQVFGPDVTGTGYPDAIGAPTTGPRPAEKRCRTWNGQYQPPKDC